jgi:hypothetical protein
MGVHDARLFRNAIVRVRDGARSFYSAMLANASVFLRVDSGCLIPANAPATMAQLRLRQLVSDATPLEVTWAAGDLLVLDNWSMLHGRGDARGSELRELNRALVQKES